MIMAKPMMDEPVIDASEAVGAARSTQVRCCGTSGHRFVRSLMAAFDPQQTFGNLEWRGSSGP
jgi:hypothetical protein